MEEIYCLQADSLAEQQCHPLKMLLASNHETETDKLELCLLVATTTTGGPSRVLCHLCDVQQNLEMWCKKELGLTTKIQDGAGSKCSDDFGLRRG